MKQMYVHTRRKLENQLLDILSGCLKSRTVRGSLFEPKAVLLVFYRTKAGYCNFFASISLCQAGFSSTIPT